MTKQEGDQALLDALGLSHLTVESLRLTMNTENWAKLEVVIRVPPERVGDLGYRLKTFDLVPRKEVYGE
jgi:hypothetical protein